MIIVAGDSWSAGAYRRVDQPGNRIIHEGLTQYIRETGQDVVKLSIGGGSNLSVARQIRSWLERNPKANIEKIFVFQTDYARDYAMVFDEDHDNIKTAEHFSGIFIKRFYCRLMEIANDFGVSINVIGGLSDTLSPELITVHYPSIKIVCQSMCNLLLKGDDRIDIPVLSRYTAAHLPMVEKLKPKLSSDQMDILLDLIDQGVERESMIFSCTEYFWPDGVHPNIAGHKKLFDFLTDRGYLS